MSSNLTRTSNSTLKFPKMKIEIELSDNAIELLSYALDAHMEHLEDEELDEFNQELDPLLQAVLAYYRSKAPKKKKK